MRYVIVTGAAGFIGFHLSLALLKKGYRVLGIDNLNSYYDVGLKRKRLRLLNTNKNFYFQKIDISDAKKLFQISKRFKIIKIFHLAAQAGVRYSFQHPETYTKSNLLGFFNILQLSKELKIKRLVFASTSSVYGNNKKSPFSENHITDQPIQYYAATKKSNEVMAFAYSSLYKIPMIGLRFFTVYGPWGRPDMALFRFTKNIIKGKKIDVFNYGFHSRDFTYIDDLVEGIMLAGKVNLNKSNNKYYQIFNLGSNKPIKLMKYIQIIEKILKKKAKINFMPLQKGDIVKTFCNIKKSQKILKYKPKTKVEIGIKNFINWYKDNYKF